MPEFIASTLMQRIKFVGTFVEFGCADGVTNSNTYAFEQLGWTGLCIEPNRKAYQKAARVRKQAINALVTKEPGHYTYAEMSGGCAQLSGVIEYYSPEFLEMMQQCEAKNSTNLQKHVLPGIPLETLLRRYGMDTVTWISIDCEGCEANFIESFNFTHYDVQIVNYEPNTAASRRTAEILAALTRHGFVEVPGSASGKFIDRLFTRDSMR